MTLHDGTHAYTGPDEVDDEEDRATPVVSLRVLDAPPAYRRRRALLVVALVFPWSLVALAGAATVERWAAVEAVTRDVAVAREYAVRCAPALAGRAWSCSDGMLVRAP